MRIDWMKRIGRAGAFVAGVFSAATAAAAAATLAPGPPGAVAVTVPGPGSRVRGPEGTKLNMRVVAPVTPLEAELAQLLAARPTANDFPAHAAILRFEAGAEGVHHTLAVEVPLASLRVAEENGLFAGHVQVLVRLKDADRRVLHRFHLDRTLAAPSLAQVQAQRLVWTGQVHLPRGRYILETVARDVNSGGASVRRVAFDSPEVAAGMRLGSVALLQPTGGNHARDGAPDDDPLFLKGEALLPTLKLETVAGPSSRVEFFTIVYPDRASAEPLVVRLDLMRGGEIVASTKLKVAPPDERGEVRYAGALPIRNLAPAEYRIRLNAQQGTTVAVEEALFTVVSGSELAAMRLDNTPVVLGGGPRPVVVRTRRSPRAAARAYAPSPPPLRRSGATSR
jgi:hypothetical protein